MCRHTCVSRTFGPDMYQLELRTSNLSRAYLENTGKMIANEGGAITYKFNNGQVAERLCAGLQTRY